MKPASILVPVLFFVTILFPGAPSALAAPAAPATPPKAAGGGMILPPVPMGAPPPPMGGALPSLVPVPQPVPVFAPPPTLAPIPPASKRAESVLLATPNETPTLLPPPSQFKVGTGAQMYLAFMNDARDLYFLSENAKAQAVGSQEAYRAYLNLYRRDLELSASGAISQDELEQRRLELDVARAMTAVHQTEYEAYHARLEGQLLQAKFAKGEPIDLEALFKWYEKEWNAQCEGSRKATDEARAHVRLKSYLFQQARRLVLSQAISQYELQLREKDLVAAQADLAAKRTLDQTCRDDLPTLQEIKEIAQTEMRAAVAQREELLKQMGRQKTATLTR